MWIGIFGWTPWTDADRTFTCAHLCWPDTMRVQHCGTGHPRSYAPPLLGGCWVGKGLIKQSKCWKASLIITVLPCLSNGQHVGLLWVFGQYRREMHTWDVWSPSDTISQGQWIRDRYAISRNRYEPYTLPELKYGGSKIGHTWSNRVNSIKICSNFRTHWTIILGVPLAHHARTHASIK